MSLIWIMSSSGVYVSGVLENWHSIYNALNKGVRLRYKLWV
jgi:hypothetical protein